ncbi:hypothetical protein [Mycobacterium sp. ST-F2]|uniref:hypothetical protein n=1 Tax=Mycobacterium sp. ST-F2 TaxID=1490484 RepID=UPI0014389377|nr:hypothetical protein [Mycobacterium sp. ST-F2]
MAMMELLTPLVMLLAGAVLAAFVILIAVDVAIFLRLRSSFPQHPGQYPKAH